MLFRTSILSKRFDALHRELAQSYAANVKDAARSGPPRMCTRFDMLSQLLDAGHNTTSMFARDAALAINFMVDGVTPLTFELCVAEIYLLCPEMSDPMAVHVHGAARDEACAVRPGPSWPSHADGRTRVQREVGTTCLVCGLTGPRKRPRGGGVLGSGTEDAMTGIQ
jgi:hypothetical protein